MQAGVHYRQEPLGEVEWRSVWLTLRLSEWIVWGVICECAPGLQDSEAGCEGSEAGLRTERRDSMVGLEVYVPCQPEV